MTGVQTCALPICTDENGILRILLDTGASATIILKDAIRDLNGPVLKEQTTTWNTVGGQFVTTLKSEIQFTLSEFSTSKSYNGNVMLTLKPCVKMHKNVT